MAWAIQNIKINFKTFVIKKLSLKSFKRKTCVQLKISNEKKSCSNEFSTCIRKERENMKPLIIYAFAEVKEEKWWISLKLNSNKKQFLLFLFHFITFHNLLSFLYIPVLSLFVVPYKPRVKKTKNNLSNHENFVSIQIRCYLHKNVINSNATRDLLMHLICINNIQISTHYWRLTMLFS